jgi:hypothetical protein
MLEHIRLNDLTLTKRVLHVLRENNCYFVVTLKCKMISDILTMQHSNNNRRNSMSDNTNPSNELASTRKQYEELGAKIEALLKLSREQDLKKAKELISTHAFTAKDLAPELKRVTARAATPRKSPVRRKKA